MLSAKKKRVPTLQKPAGEESEACLTVTILTPLHSRETMAVSSACRGVS